MKNMLSVLGNMKRNWSYSNSDFYCDFESAQGDVSNNSTSFTAAYMKHRDKLIRFLTNIGTRFNHELSRWMCSAI